MLEARRLRRAAAAARQRLDTAEALGSSARERLDTAEALVSARQRLDSAESSSAFQHSSGSEFIPVQETGQYA